MRLVRSLQHWLGGAGPRLPVADCVPDTHPLRQWADTFPWAALVPAIEHSFATRFPPRSPRGRAPLPLRVWVALELLKHALGAADEDICHRLRTDLAVMYACGLQAYQAPRSPAHFVLPETLREFRGRLDAERRETLIAIQAAAAMEAGLVRPAHLVVDPFPCAPGSHRVTDATTLEKAQTTPCAQRRYRPAMPPPGQPPTAPSPQSPTGAAKGQAWLWPPVPGAGPCLRDLGAPNCTTTPRPWPAPPGPWPASAATP